MDDKTRKILAIVALVLILLFTGSFIAYLYDRDMLGGAFGYVAIVTGILGLALWFVVRPRRARGDDESEAPDDEENKTPDNADNAANTEKTNNAENPDKTENADNTDNTDGAETSSDNTDGSPDNSDGGEENAKDNFPDNSDKSPAENSPKGRK